MELSSIKRFADYNYSLLSSPSTEEAAKAVDIGFEFEDQHIADPWIDPSGRYALSTEKAIETYGIENILRYCNEANTYIKDNTTSKNATRDFIRNRLDMAILAYRNSNKPNEAAATLVSAMGPEDAAVCIATLVNAVSLSDGRISDRVRTWAQSTPAPKHSELWAMHIYGVDSYIHSAHVDQLGNAMLKYTIEEK